MYDKKFFYETNCSKKNTFFNLVYISCANAIAGNEYSFFYMSLCNIYIK